VGNSHKRYHTCGFYITEGKVTRAHFNQRANQKKGDVITEERNWPRRDTFHQNYNGGYESQAPNFYDIYQQHTYEQCKAEIFTIDYGLTI
jgi:hypothetical protein